MRTHLSRLLFATLLIGPAALSGCAALAVGAVGVIVSQEFIDNAQVAYVQDESERVWATAKSTLSHMSLEPIEVDNDLKAARARIDNALVTVQIETYDVGETRIRVAAKKILIYNGEIAEEVLRKIRKDLEDTTR